MANQTQRSADLVKRNIARIQRRNRAIVYAICVDFAARALNEFRERQPTGVDTAGEFWHNQSGQAAARVFSSAFREGDVLGWFLAHAVQYGVYLELANNRQNEALRPIVLRYQTRFFRAVTDVFRD